MHLHCQHSCHVCLTPRWPRVVDLRQLEPKGSFWTKFWPSLIPQINLLGSDCLAAAIQGHLVLRHPRQWCWWCYGGISNILLLSHFSLDLTIPPTDKLGETCVNKFNRCKALTYKHSIKATWEWYAFEIRLHGHILGSWSCTIYIIFNLELSSQLPYWLMNIELVRGESCIVKH